MSAIEQAALLLRKAASQHVPPDQAWPLLGSEP